MVKFCPRCNYPNDDNNQFCMRCGYPFKYTFIDDDKKRLLKGFRLFSIINIISLIYLSVVLGLAYLLNGGSFFNNFTSFLGFLGTAMIGLIILFLSIFKLKGAYAKAMQKDPKYRLPYFGTLLLLLSFVLVAVYSLVFLSTSVMGLFIPSTSVPFFTLSISGVFILGAVMSNFLGAFRAFEDFRDKVFLVSSFGFLASAILACITPFVPILLIPLWLLYLVSVTLLYAASDYNLSLSK